MYGFGANNTNTICFPCNFNYEKPQLPGVKGLLDAYHYALNAIEPGYSALAADALETVLDVATEQEQNQYQVTVLLTHGDVCDLSNCMAACKKYQHAACSLIIIGLGTGNFDKLKLLAKVN